MKTLAEKFLENATFKPIVEIDYNDIDALITEFFTGYTIPYPREFQGKVYECVAYEEWNNYETHSFDIEPQKINNEDFEKAKRGKWEHFSTNDYLNHMCAEGVIPECELYISIYW